MRSDEVHLWWIDADHAGEPTPALVARLSATDRRRTAQLTSDADRKLFAVAHVALAGILDRYGATGAIDRRCPRCGDPEHGKPRVPSAAVDFSLSHAGRRAVAAVTPWPSLVGVDIECVSANPGLDAMRRALGPRVDDLEVAGRPAATWCRLEAVGKATGHGVLGAAPRVRLDAERPGDGGWLQAIDDERRPWQLRSLDPGDGYEGALAIVGDPHRIHERAWTPAG